MPLYQVWRVWKFNVLLVLHDIVSLSHNTDLLHCHKISHFSALLLNDTSCRCVTLRHTMSRHVMFHTASNIVLRCVTLCYVVVRCVTSAFKIIQRCSLLRVLRDLKRYYKLSQPHYTESDLETIKRNSASSEMWLFSSKKIPLSSLWLLASKLNLVSLSFALIF